MINKCSEAIYSEAWKYAAGRLAQMKDSKKLLGNFFDCLKSYPSLKNDCLNECPGYIDDFISAQPETVGNSSDKPGERQSRRKESLMSNLGLFIGKLDITSEKQMPEILLKPLSARENEPLLIDFDDPEIPNPEILKFTSHGSKK